MNILVWEQQKWRIISQGIMDFCQRQISMKKLLIKHLEKKIETQSLRTISLKIIQLECQDIQVIYQQVP
jgi:hypothetical protein